VSHWQTVKDVDGMIRHVLFSWDMWIFLGILGVIQGAGMWWLSWRERRKGGG
jgi:hypothetical protein